jgi:hypothetical protein
MAFDAKSGKVLLFGGAYLSWQATNGSVEPFYNDTWAYEASPTQKKWVQLHADNPNAVPSQRWGHAMALHSKSGFVVLHGGDEGGYFDGKNG